MTLRIIGTYIKCFRAFVINSGVLSITFLNGKTTFFNINDGFKVLFELDFKVRDFVNLSNRYLVSSSDEGNECYEKSEDGLPTQVNYVYRNYINHYCIKFEGKRENISFFDLNTNLNLFELDFLPRPFGLWGKYVFLEKGDENGRFRSIYCFNLDEKIKLWELDIYLDDFKIDTHEYVNSIKKILGAYDGYLYVIMVSGLLLKVDISTGKIVKEFQEEVVINRLITKNKFHALQEGFVDVSTGKIYGGTPEFGIFDLHSEELEVIELNKFYEKDLLQVHRVLNLDDAYLFVNDYLNFRIGIVDKLTLELLCTYEYQNSNKARPLDMKIHDDYLFIYDDRKTLTVFEIIK